jgi:hypothetical protein
MITANLTLVAKLLGQIDHGARRPAHLDFGVARLPAAPIIEHAGGVHNAWSIENNSQAVTSFL